MLTYFIIAYLLGYIAALVFFLYDACKDFGYVRKRDLKDMLAVSLFSWGLVVPFFIFWVIIAIADDPS